MNVKELRKRILENSTLTEYSDGEARECNHCHRYVWQEGNAAKPETWDHDTDCPIQANRIALKLVPNPEFPQSSFVTMFRGLDYQFAEIEPGGRYWTAGVADGLTVELWWNDFANCFVAEFCGPWYDDSNVCTSHNDFKQALKALEDRIDEAYSSLAEFVGRRV